MQSIPSMIRWHVVSKGDSLAQKRSDITIGFLKSMNTDTGTRIGQTNYLSILDKKVKGELEEDS